jgi:transcription initiation factor IIF auxiliary subunit
MSLSLVLERELKHGAAKQGTDYTIKVTLGAHHPDLLARVEKVVYHLHENIKDNVREVTDKGTDFALTFTASGQFEMKADVYLKDRNDPIKIRRWLNF